MAATLRSNSTWCRDRKVHAPVRDHGGVDGTLLDEIDDPDALADAVHRELVDLRGARGRFTIEKFTGYPVLRRVCGGGDLLDGFLTFERELRRYAISAGRDEAAAALSIQAPAETVLDRLEHVVAALPQDGQLRDQRTARRWSDRGLRTIAGDLVHLAEVQGRLGRELLAIEVTGDGRDGLLVTIDQMTALTLPAKPPLVRVWHYDEDGATTEAGVDVDLREIPSALARDMKYEMRRFRLLVEMPGHLHGRVPGSKLLGVSVEGRDAPTRTTSLHAALTPGATGQVTFSVYRTLVAIDFAS